VGESDRPKSAQDKLLDAVRAVEDSVSGTPPCERKTHIVMSGFSRSSSTQGLDNHEVIHPKETFNVTPITSTPVSHNVEPSQPLRESHSPIPQHPSLNEEDDIVEDINLNETPLRKRTLPPTMKPLIAPKPSRESRATSEPIENFPVLSGGEPTSLPSTQGSTDSPMPELLSLKDRLKLFEREIDDQQKVPEPKKDRKFSFLSEDEVLKMKEEEARRIASMTAMDLEAFDSMTSHHSLQEDEKVIEQQVSELSQYDCGEVPKVDDESDKLHQEDDDGNDEVDNHLTESEKRAAWRKARLQSLESDAIQAQIVIEKMSELNFSTDKTDQGLIEDNATYRHSVDVQGNITECKAGNGT